MRATRTFLRWIQEREREEIEKENRSIMHRMKRCGEGVGLWGKVHITGVENMSLGDNVHIGRNAFIRAEGGLEIGANTHISRNLLLYTINHDYNGRRIPYDEKCLARSVSIGRNVWIGMNVCIAPGTTIGDGVIVGMGTTVSGCVPAMSIIGAQKWRIVGMRDEAHYEECDRANAYAGPSGRPFIRSEQKQIESADNLSK